MADNGLKDNPGASHSGGGQFFPRRDSKISCALLLTTNSITFYAFRVFLATNDFQNQWYYVQCNPGNSSYEFYAKYFATFVMSNSFSWSFNLALMQNQHNKLWRTRTALIHAFFFTFCYLQQARIQRFKEVGQTD